MCGGNTVSVYRQQIYDWTGMSLSLLHIKVWRCQLVVINMSVMAARVDSCLVLFGVDIMPISCQS